MNIISKYLAKKELYKTFTQLSIMRDFCYNYFSYKFLITKSYTIRQNIIQSLTSITHCNDSEQICNVFQTLPGSLSNFWYAFKEDLRIYSDLSLYLLYPIESIIIFIESNRILPADELLKYRNELESLRNFFEKIIVDHIETSNSTHNDVIELCNFIREQFPAYCSAKRGHPILRTLSQIAGGLLGGYASASLGGNINDCLNLGSLASEGLQVATETFTSGTTQNKISAYESLIDDTSSAIMSQIEEIQEQFDDFRHDCYELLSELHEEIVIYINSNNLRRKDIRNLTYNINYLSFQFQRRGISKHFKNTGDVLQYIKQNKFLSNKEYRQLLKLL